MKAIQKIKDKVIRLLGGITQKEVIKNLKFYYVQGLYSAYLDMIVETEVLYGEPADEWCKAMYDHISQNYNRNYKEYIQASKEVGTDADDRIYRNIQNVE